MGGLVLCAAWVWGHNHNEEALAACEDLEGHDCHAYCVYYHENDGRTLDRKDFWDHASDCAIVPEVIVKGQRPTNAPNWVSGPHNNLYDYEFWEDYWANPPIPPGQPAPPEPSPPACDSTRYSDPGGVSGFSVVDGETATPNPAVGLWGVTNFDEPDEVRLSFEMYCHDENTWKARITTAKCNVEYGALLPSDVTQVDEGTIDKSSSCTDLRAMLRDLSKNNSTSTKYYRREANLAHEKLHVQRFRSDVTSAFKTAQGVINGVSVSVSGSATPNEARKTFLESFLVKGALAQFQRRYTQSVIDEENHVGGGYTEAELDEMAPYRERIVVRLNSLGCN